MHGWKTRMRLKQYLDEGVSKTELSRRFGVSRRTIHHWIETGQLDRDLEAGCTRREPRSRVHKLDPYKAIIDDRLAEFPRLTARRLFDEVRAAGYPGGYGRVNDYVRAVRNRNPRRQPAPPQAGVPFGPGAGTPPPAAGYFPERVSPQAGPREHRARSLDGPRRPQTPDGCTTSLSDS